MTTALMAASVALGSVTGVVPVALLSLLWMLSLVFVGVRLVVAPARRWTASHWVFVVGVAAAALRMGALGVDQVLRSRPALLWNADWRYHITQAYGIARFGGLSDSLDYAGRPVEYHAGPSWIAGGLHRVFGLPVDVCLFVLVPVACVLVIGLSGYRLLRCLGAGERAALLAVAVAVSLPMDPLGMVHDLALGRLGAVFLDPEAWWFTPGLMLNSLLALAVGMTAAWVIVGARSIRRAALGGLTLATLMSLKPQYFVGFVGVLGLGYFFDLWRERDRETVRRGLVVAATVVVPAAVFSSIVEPAAKFTGVEVDVSGFESTHFLSASNLMLLAAATIVLLALVPTARRAQSSAILRYSLGAAAGVAFLYVFLGSTTFLLDAALVERSHLIGTDYVRSMFDVDVHQALLPATLVIVMLALAQLVALFRGPARWNTVVPVVTAGLLIVLTAPFAVSALADPTGQAAYEPTEERDLAALLARVDADSGVWIASDMADPSKDFYPPLTAVNLTSLGDAQFYVSNVQYGGWTQPDVVQRVRNLERFFETDWSPWHARFPERHGIRFVLVRDRCPPPWDMADFPGRVVEKRGDWTLLEVGAARGTAASGARPWPAFTEEPPYGRSACLAGNLVRW
ncbi:MAG: hypothetical protein WDA60_01840 [Acidimicrobiia bacterium]